MGRKKTTEEYKLELEEVNKKNGTNIRLKEGVEYVRADINILHICTCGKEWDAVPSSILSNNSKYCGLCYTLMEWGIDNLGDDFLKKYWDYEKNNELGNNPCKISCGSDKYIYIYCQEKEYHGSYKMKCYEFAKLGYRCTYCKGNKLIHPKDSFAQYLIDTYGENALELYWDYEKNKIDPYFLKAKSGKKIYIYCQEKNYHGSYPVICAGFVDGSRCGYCTNRNGKIHLLDSLGTLYPKSLEIWSDKNKKSPYEYAPHSGQYVWWKCPEGKHEDYYRDICNSTLNCNFRCPDCSNEQSESIMATTLKQVLKHEYTNTIWEHDVGFRTPKGYISRYDIYVPYLDNLLIECQSEYHDNPKQQEIDKLKKEYALDNEYNYLAIDKRDYTPLEAIQIFFPNIDEIPIYIDISKNTNISWNIEKAQKLLDEGYTYLEVANMIEVKYSCIVDSINRDLLIKPKDYKIKNNKNFIKIVCLDKENNKLIRIYNSLTEAAIDIKGSIKNISLISMVLKNKNKSAYGYKWMYYDKYIELNNNQNT